MLTAHCSVLHVTKPLTESSSESCLYLSQRHSSTPLSTKFDLHSIIVTKLLWHSGTHHWLPRPSEWRLLHVTLAIAVSRGLLSYPYMRFSGALELSFSSRESDLSIVQISLNSICMIQQRQGGKCREF